MPVLRPEGVSARKSPAHYYLSYTKSRKSQQIYLTLEQKLQATFEVGKNYPIRTKPSERVNSEGSKILFWAIRCSAAALEKPWPETDWTGQRIETVCTGRADLSSDKLCQSFGCCDALIRVILQVDSHIESLTRTTCKKGCFGAPEHQESTRLYTICVPVNYGGHRSHLSGSGPVPPRPKRDSERASDTLPIAPGSLRNDIGILTGLIHHPVHSLSGIYLTIFNYNRRTDPFNRRGLKILPV